VIDKDFCSETELPDLIRQMDSLMNNGQIFKNGNTCYVSRINWNGKDIVVKRYNHKGLIHSLRHTIKGARAKRCWLNGHRLLMLGIATPKPLAFIEEYHGLLVWKSYLITEYVQGQMLYDFLRDRDVSEEQRLKVTQQIRELLDKLEKHRIVHGDLKHTNILISEGNPVLTDLDAMQIYAFGSIYKIKRAKDSYFLSADKKNSSAVNLV
jgi:tRNA A-37 threonylcarbamoyl transferase component Bud32